MSTIIESLLGESLGNAVGVYPEDPVNNHLIAETAILEGIQNEATISKMTELLESSDLHALLRDGVIGEDSVRRMENILQEKTIVKMDKSAKLNRATKMATFAIAREKGDRDFKKLLFVWKMERFLEDKLDKKYTSQAAVRAKKMIKNQKSGLFGAFHSKPKIHGADHK